MNVFTCPSAVETGRCAAEDGAIQIRNSLVECGKATIIVGTGTSQLEMLSALVKAPDVDWSRVTAFHLDEYIGISQAHPASFRRYMEERFVNKVPIGTFHYVNGEGDVLSECTRLNELIRAEAVDVAFVGIGENGHLAFNDPPADFETQLPFIVVDIDDACRRQQHGEGWFERLEDVSHQAISMSIRQIMKARHIICTVPDQRKAEAVRSAVEGPVTPLVPASILQKHDHARLYLDPSAASLLQKG